VIQVNATFDVQTLSLQVKCLESEVAWWRFWNSEEGFFAIKKHPLILADYADPVFGLECISPCNLWVLSVTVVVGITNQTRPQSHNTAEAAEIRPMILGFALQRRELVKSVDIQVQRPIW